MKTRPFGKTNILVSEISLGTWQLGSRWGDPFNDEIAYETLKSAQDLGINTLDTADVYQGGMSEKAIGNFNLKQDDKMFVITKVGRKLPQQDKTLYTKENLTKFIDDSRKNLQVDALDMVLLHCPPTDLYEDKTVFDFMDDFKKQGKIKHYGVSIEKIEEGILAMNYPGVEAIEVIFNMFRLRPAQELFNIAKEKGVGIIVRVPLASGLLTGKYTKKTTFGPNDHRTFNRQGEAFDKGETFSGVPYDIGLEAVEELKKVFPEKELPLYALRWILMFDSVSTVIPGASRPEQIIENVKAADLKPLTKHQMDEVERIYNTYIKPHVHHLW
ncbi:MAG: aldo/keto reductase [Acholeplasmataceae bacterium]|jgi:aryl-alcohol dehydrogenase-like predicted oxidoreductase|nr:aldo/keto reductase [Acholeplasmataceae bacterium]